MKNNHLRILLVNDDGLFAPGMKILEKIARRLSDDITIVAPAEEMSACGRLITVTRPLRLQKIDTYRWALNGSPTDCVLLAIHEIMAQNPPDLVLSGVNLGQNVAEDTSQSGTIAGAFQALIMGVPACSLSLAMDFDPKDRSHKWDCAAQHAPGLLQKIIDHGLSKDHILNLNFPDRQPDQVEGVQVTRQGSRDHLIAYSDQRQDLRRRDYHWLGFKGKLSNPPEGTDLHAVYNGYISITPLGLDMTRHEALSNLEKSDFCVTKNL